MNKELQLVFELLPYNLETYIEKSKGNKQFGEMAKRILFYQVVKAVSYLHSRAIIHRDLKLQNILINKKGIPKIADFGLARGYSLPIGSYTHEVVTLAYRAPEILLGAEQYSTAIDTWSVGCILAEMFSGKKLFHGDSEIGQLYAIFQVLGTPNEENWPGVSKLRDYKNFFPKWSSLDRSKICPGLSEDGLDLLEKMLRYDPLQRISMKEALKHPFLKGLIHS